MKMNGNFAITTFVIFSITLTLALTLNGVSSFKLVHKVPIDAKANWPLVEDYIYIFDALIGTAAGEIAFAAYYDNTEVALRILEMLSDSYYAVEGLLILVHAEVDNKNLTVPVAREHLGEVYTVIVDLQINITPEFEFLQPSTVEEINGIFTKLFFDIPLLAAEIYAALEEPDAPSCGLRGHGPNEVIIPAEPTHTDTLPGTVIWLGNSFGVSETFVQLHPHNKYLDSEETHQSPAQFLVKTTRDFGNFIDEMNVTSIHRNVMFLCTDGTSVTNPFEIPVITGPIVEPTVKPVFD